ncbi:MAG: TrmH family RNA methyltransferase [Bacteroidetes bacterium]|nr:TrmH family RNA methyltransferase [Bacteroidota bacterium]
MTELGRKTDMETRTNPEHDILLILDNVRSMHNVGSAFRTADAFGLAGIYLCGYTPRPPHRDIHKTALGAENSVAWQHFDHTSVALGRAKALGYTLIAVEQTLGSTELNKCTIAQNSKVALIFGNEVEGVSDYALSQVAAVMEIPQFGSKHSLNISVSIGVVLWEIIRQKS